MSFDLTKAIMHLRSHAKTSKPYGQCAAYVKKALAAGGLPYISGVDGFGVGKAYEKYGYRRVNLKQNGKNFVGAAPGDICSIATNVRIGGKCQGYSKDGEIYPGHACMYDGKKWISDFVQGNCIPYSLGSVKWARVWRWKDTPGDFKVPDDDNSYGGGSSGESGSGSGESGGVTRYVYKEQYPVHSEYVTYSGNGGNIFEKAEQNAANFSQAQYDTDSPISKKQDKHIRIYSTNDSCIVLDSLSIPTDYENDIYANKGITKEDVKAHKTKLEEQEKKAKEEQEKKKQEEEKDKDKDNKDKDKGKEKDKEKGKDKDKKK